MAATGKTRESENDNLRPAGDGKPPRPATEPPGAEWSTRSTKTATDPGTGAPNRRGPKAPPR